MEDIELSAAARREQNALQTATIRMRTERLAWEKKAKALEVLVLRKEEMVRRQQEFLAEIQIERQAIEAEFKQICNMSISS